MSDDTLGNIKVLKWPELPQTSDERTIDGLIDALLEAETAEQIIGCRNELLTAWMGWQAPQEPVLAAIIKRLKTRLEVSPDHPYDGIATRDETIKLLTTELAAAKKDAERFAFCVCNNWIAASIRTTRNIQDGDIKSTRAAIDAATGSNT